MKIYAKYENEICELWNYENMKDRVVLKSESEGIIRVPKRDIEIIGFRNGKGDSGELIMLGGEEV